MTFSSRFRRALLFMHVATSVGLLGGVACFLVFAMVGVASAGTVLKISVYTVLPHLTNMLIIPLLVLSLVIGLVSAHGTPWGVLRHYWLVTKLALTLVSLAVLVVQLPIMSKLAQNAALGGIEPSEFPSQVRLVIHAAGGLAVLCLATWLSIYKPRGQTKFDF